MDALYQKPEPMVGDGASSDDLAAPERAQLFGSDIRTSRTRAAERFRASGARTGELRQDWQSAFVLTHIGRAGLIV